MAIVRAATCAEIAANILIRTELSRERSLEPAFVNSLLHWANGLQGKLSRIILPLFKGTPDHKRLQMLLKSVSTLNDTRNAIAHSGQFAGHATARKLLTLAHAVCMELASPYVSGLTLKSP